MMSMQLNCSFVFLEDAIGMRVYGRDWPAVKELNVTVIIGYFGHNLGFLVIVTELKLINCNPVEVGLSLRSDREGVRDVQTRTPKSKTQLEPWRIIYEEGSAFL